MLGTGVALAWAWLEHPHQWRPPGWDAEADATTAVLIAWQAVEDGHRCARWGDLLGGFFGWKKQAEGGSEEFPKPPAQQQAPASSQTS